MLWHYLCDGHLGATQQKFGVPKPVEYLQDAIIDWMLNQGLLRFLNPNPAATEEMHDQWTSQVTTAVQQCGEAFFGCTTER